MMVALQSPRLSFFLPLLIFLYGVSFANAFHSSSPAAFARILTRKEGKIADRSTADGPVLRPSGPDDPTQFDTDCVANPVVLPPLVTGTSKWQCYYYGHAGSWAGGAPSFLPTGWIGLAESDDGISWAKVTGSDELGSILAPTGNRDDWDGVHIGVGDVVRVSDSELHMYYFGSDGEAVVNPLNEAMPPTCGLRMRIGRARSTDNGRTWKRMGLTLDFDPTEGLFASWPRILIPDNVTKPWRMLYHSFNGQEWAVFGATSFDKGDTWQRDGMVLSKGSEGEWDSKGIGTRSIAQKDGTWVMVYEGVDNVMTHRLGVARFDEKVDGSYSWTKAEGTDYDAPGGPILKPGAHPLGPWTSKVIGTPFLVSMEDGSMRLYFVSKAEGANMSIGMVESETGELETECWKAVSPPHLD